MQENKYATFSIKNKIRSLTSELKIETERIFRDGSEEIDLIFNENSKKIQLLCNEIKSEGDDGKYFSRTKENGKVIVTSTIEIKQELKKFLLDNITNNINNQSDDACNIIMDNLNELLLSEPQFSKDSVIIEIKKEIQIIKESARSLINNIIKEIDTKIISDFHFRESYPLKSNLDLLLEGRKGVFPLIMVISILGLNRSDTIANILPWAIGVLFIYSFIASTLDYRDELVENKNKLEERYVLAINRFLRESSTLYNRKLRKDVGNHFNKELKKLLGNIESTLEDRTNA